MNLENPIFSCENHEAPAKVAALVVTFNRKILLLDCLTALLGQTRPVNRIFLVDNASTDGTFELLAEKGYLENPRIQYRKLPVNEGGAGGFHEGAKWAYEEGYDWLWLMDDDSKPMPDALEELSRHFGDHTAIALVPAIEASDGTRINRCDKFHFSKWRIVHKTLQVDFSGVASVDTATFVGLLVRSSVVKRAGFPAKKFFIYGDDTEYCLRLRKYGSILLISSSRIVHQEARQKQVSRVKRFGRSSPRVEFKNLWVHYFTIRNGIWLCLHGYSENPGFLINLTNIISRFALYLRWVAGILLYDDHKWKRILFYSHAFYDGVCNKWDNEKPKWLLQKS
jgi:GT2 family glycosyltransferase